MLFVYYIDTLSMQNEASFASYLSRVEEKIKFDFLSRTKLDDKDDFIICTIESANSSGYYEFNSSSSLNYFDKNNKPVYVSQMLDNLSKLKREKGNAFLSWFSIIERFDTFYSNELNLKDTILRLLAWERDPDLLYTLYFLSHANYPVYMNKATIKLTLFYVDNGLNYGNTPSILEGNTLNLQKITLLEQMIPSNVSLDLVLPGNNQYTVFGKSRRDLNSIAHIIMLRDFYNRQTMASSNPLNILDVLLGVSMPWIAFPNNLDSQDMLSDLPPNTSNPVNPSKVHKKKGPTKVSRKEPSANTLQDVKPRKKRAEVIVNEVFESNKKIRDKEPADVVNSLKVPVLNASKEFFVVDDENQFDYVKSESPSELEQHLFFAPVAVLKKTSRNLGVFTDKLIPKDSNLGFYHGRLITLDDKQQDWEYTFKLNETTGVDAFLERNWTAFVNSSSADSNANVFAEEQKGRIIYKALKDINPDEQLLIYYDEFYQFNAAQRRFLKSTDTYFDSNEIINQYPSLYSSAPRNISEDALNCFGIEQAHYFRVPKYTINGFIPGNLNHYFDMPILAVDSRDGVTSLPQCEQENITPLMLAILEEDKNLVFFLLSQGADSTIQTSIRGLSALHVLMKSRLGLEDKKFIMDELVKYGARLDAQDYQEQSILHTAISTRNLELVLHVLSYKNNYGDLLKYINNDNYDPFLYSISLDEINIAKELFKLLKRSDILDYFEDEEQFKLLSETLSGVENTDEFLEVRQLFIDKLNAYQSSAHQQKVKQLLCEAISQANTIEQKPRDQSNALHDVSMKF